MATTSTGSEVVPLDLGLSVTLAALQTLWNLEDRGLAVQVADDGGLLVGPRTRLTDVDRDAIRRYRDELITLVRHLDEGVQDRREAFARQFATAPAGTVPRFVFKANVAYRAGRCHSCGDVLRRLVFSRCWRCALAWRLACRLPISIETARALDEARVA